VTMKGPLESLRQEAENAEQTLRNDWKCDEVEVFRDSFTLFWRNDRPMEQNAEALAEKLKKVAWAYPDGTVHGDATGSDFMVTVYFSRMTNEVQ